MGELKESQLKSDLGKLIVQKIKSRKRVSPAKTWEERLKVYNAHHVQMARPKKHVGHSMSMEGGARRSKCLIKKQSVVSWLHKS